MRKLVSIASLVFLCSFNSGRLFAQLKVGSNPTTINTNSILELESTSQGFVLPRISISSVSSSSPLTATLLTGTVVYNTNASTTGGSGAGIYYWDGSKWVFLATASNLGSYWSLTGNSGTTPSSAAIGSAATGNFIGTTDAKDFVVATNNLERIRVASGGNIGINTVAPVALFDVQGLSAATGNIVNVTANSLTTGTALNVNSTGTITSGGNIASFTGNAATTGNILTLSGTALTSGSVINATAGTTTGSAINLTSNGVTTGNGMSITVNGLTSGSGLNISSSSAAGTTSSLINLVRSGSSASQTAYGIKSTLTSGGTSSTNIGGYFKSSGATTNYGVIVPSSGGYSGFNTSSPVSHLDVNGSFGRAITATPVTGATTLDDTYSTIIATPGASSYNITLPAANTASRRDYRIIYNGVVGSSKINVVTTGADLLYLDGTSYSTYVLANGSITVQSDGNNKWYVVEDNSGGSGGTVGKIFAGTVLAPSSPTVSTITVSLAGTGYTLTSNSLIFVSTELNGNPAASMVYSATQKNVASNSFDINCSNGKYPGNLQINYIIIN